MAESSEISYAPEAQKNELLKQSIDPNTQRQAMERLMSGIDKANKQKEFTQQSAKKDQVESKADLDKELSMLDGGAKVEGKRVNNSFDHVLSGVDPNKTIQKEVGQITKDLEPGKSNIDIKNEVFKMMDSLGEAFPFLKKIFGSFRKMFGDKDQKNTELEKIKDEEQRKILDKYGVKVETPTNGTNNLTFNKDAKIQGEKTMKPVNSTGTTKAPEKTPIKLKNDNSLIIDFKNATSADIKDNDNGFTLTVNNKDGSIDTYKVESPKAPTTSPEKKPA